jgi:hypothetical protein
MNKIIRIACVVIIMFAFSLQKVHAQTENPTTQVEPQNVQLISEELEYTLPFPGILPDHPLYFVKSTRDAIMRMFISNPIKKVEFSLLQSDKYLSMAIVYADMKKWDRAGQTVVQSQKEMEQAIAEVGDARKSGVVIPNNVINNMERSTVKHTQLIEGMKKQSEEKPNGVFQKSADAFAQLAAQVSALKEE